MSTPARIPKPKLRGMYQAFITRGFALNAVAAAIVGTAYWFGIVAPRKKKYSDFYENFTEEKMRQDWAEMRAAGVFHSSPPDGEEMREW